jgi:sulfhydrogenase subunit gamma (sulfur reductase)
MNLYQPHLCRIEEIVDETPDTRTLRLSFKSPELGKSFDFKAGQFGEYSVFGAGECTFCIASPPTRKGYIECSFKVVGKVTRAMRQLDVGDTMGFRGPYGNAFPLDRMAGKDLVFIAGGIGLAPVRCVIWNALDLRDKFKTITIIYGARSVSDLVYKRELDQWSKRADVALHQCVDPGGETPDWRGEVCFVPSLVEKVKPSAKECAALRS